VGTHLYLQETEEAAWVTLLKSSKPAPQPPNLHPWLWKETKPTVMGPVGGAGCALGFARNDDWGSWVGSWLIRSYGEGNRQILGGFYSSAGGSDQQRQLQRVFLWAEDHQDMITQEMGQL